MNTHELERMTLIELEEHINGLAGAWNGKESVFTYGGVAYNEDDALQAQDIQLVLKELRRTLAR
jgi:hypothetical protein